MKSTLPILLSGIMMLSAYNAFSQSPQTAINRYNPPPYKPDDIKLYNTIARLDSIYFDAYNNSKADVLDSLTAEDLEFYHDRGGLSTSKTQNLASLKKYISLTSVRDDRINKLSKIKRAKPAHIF